MKRMASHLGLLALLGVMLATAGCTGTDFLVTANTPVRFEVAVDEDGAIRDYECINLQLGDITVKPLDGLCSGGASTGQPCLQSEDCPGGACVGSSATEAVSAPITLQNGNLTTIGNLTGELCDFVPPGLTPLFAQPFSPPAPILLSEGLYVLKVLRVRETVLYDDDTGFFGSCSGDLALGDAFGDGLRFTVPAAGEKVVRLVAHIDVLEAVMQAADDCTTLETTLTTAFSCATCDAAP